MAGWAGTLSIEIVRVGDCIDKARWPAMVVAEDQSEDEQEREATTAEEV